MMNVVRGRGRRHRNAHCQHTKSRRDNFYIFICITDRSTSLATGWKANAPAAINAETLSGTNAFANDFIIIFGYVFIVRRNEEINSDAQKWYDIRGSHREVTKNATTEIFIEHNVGPLFISSNSNFECVTHLNGPPSFGCRVCISCECRFKQQHGHISTTKIKQGKYGMKTSNFLNSLKSQDFPAENWSGKAFECRPIFIYI